MGKSEQQINGNPMPQNLGIFFSYFFNPKEYVSFAFVLRSNDFIDISLEAIFPELPGKITIVRFNLSSDQIQRKFHNLFHVELNQGTCTLTASSMYWILKRV
jgi:hypothetical protein